jgi:hypothetical protein
MIKIFKQHQLCSYMTEIYILNQPDRDSVIDGDLYQYYTIDKNGEMLGHTVEYKAGMDTFGTIKPTIKVPTNVADEMIKAFALTASEQGFDVDSKTKGKLEATQYHLEDMRKLLKLTK